MFFFFIIAYPGRSFIPKISKKCIFISKLLTPDDFVRYNDCMTPKQYKLLTFIRNGIVHFGKAPTFSEMKEYMEVTSNQTVGDWIAILEREGYITKDKGRLRGIRITAKGMKGFDEKLQVQKPEAVKKVFTIFSGNATTSPSFFNYTPTTNDKGINIQANNVIPAWKGGEKNGSS